MPELDQQANDRTVGTFEEAFKISTRRSVTIDVFVQYHGVAPADTDEDFDRRVAESIRRQNDRSILV